METICLQSQNYFAIKAHLKCSNDTPLSMSLILPNKGVGVRLLHFSILYRKLDKQMHLIITAVYHVINKETFGQS